VREVASDGSAAWTVRREIYFLFIGLPFAGLTDFLKRMHSVNGPLRRTQDPDFRVELRPFVIPTALDAMADHLEFWDKARSTRSYLNFKPEKD
jgi:alkanesulfonate monooxygenase SsuD/methylene tetrahydromethanopterin reductase-like flavin-dependent oxidoreductase (luciferase family)